MTETVKQIHLAAHFPGGNNTTVWGDPQSGSHIDFKSFVHLAQTADCLGQRTATPPSSSVAPSPTAHGKRGGARGPGGTSGSVTTARRLSSGRCRLGLA